jgi:hypothetical protein
VSTDTVDLAQKKRLVDGPFIIGLVALFESEDARERDYLKTIAHRIYSKLTQRRALMRRVMGQAFLGFVLETGVHHGVAELLEILASVINGFAVPIKEEHRALLVRALLPLHKAATLGAFHAQLSYCMCLYASKDHALTRDIVPALLRLWPLGATAKQMMLLNELEDLFEYVADDDAAAVAPALALRLARCVGGAHFQIAERALLLYNNERFLCLFVDAADRRATTLPLLLPALVASADGHWHEAIRTLAGQVIARYGEADAPMLAACRAELDAALAAARAPAAADAPAPTLLRAATAAGLRAAAAAMPAAADARLAACRGPPAPLAPPLAPLEEASVGGQRLPSPPSAASPCAAATAAAAAASPAEAGGGSTAAAAATHAVHRAPSVRASQGFASPTRLHDIDALPAAAGGAAGLPAALPLSSPRRASVLRGGRLPPAFDGGGGGGGALDAE